MKHILSVRNLSASAIALLSTAVLSLAKILHLTEISWVLSTSPAWIYAASVIAYATAALAAGAIRRAIVREDT